MSAHSKVTIVTVYCLKDNTLKPELEWIRGLVCKELWDEVLSRSRQIFVYISDFKCKVEHLFTALNNNAEENIGKFLQLTSTAKSKDRPGRQIDLEAPGTQDVSA